MNNFEKEKNNATIINKFEKTITVYDLGRGFFVEVNKEPDTIEFYIYNNQYGVKSLMFGIPPRDAHLEEALILANVRDCMRIYAKEYMDEYAQEDLEI